MKPNQWFAVGAILLGAMVTLLVPISIQHLVVQSPTALDDKVTLEKYEQLDTGMTYEQVAKIVGAPGKKLKLSGRKERDEFARGQLVMYTWKNHNGSGMTAAFDAGRMTLKHQSKLKLIAPD